MGEKLLILGAGGHGKVVREVALSMKDEQGKNKYEIVDFLDDNVVDADFKVDDDK